MGSSSPSDSSCCWCPQSTTLTTTTSARSVQLIRYHEESQKHVTLLSRKKNANLISLQHPSLLMSPGSRPTNTWDDLTIPPDFLQFDLVLAGKFGLRNWLEAYCPWLAGLDLAGCDLWTLCGIFWSDFGGDRYKVQVSCAPHSWKSHWQLALTRRLWPSEVTVQARCDLKSFEHNISRTHLGIFVKSGTKPTFGISYILEFKGHSDLW